MTPADITPDDVQLAERITRAAVRRLPAHIRSRFADDVRSDAMFGLVKAACDYNSDRGVSFGAYAYIRIRGEVGDGFRRIGISDRGGRRPDMLTPADDSGSDTSLLVSIGPVDYGNPDPIEQAERMIALQQAVSLVDEWVALNLTVRENYVYNETMAGATRLQIRTALGVTEGRVSQIVKDVRLRVSAGLSVESPF